MNTEENNELLNSIEEQESGDTDGIIESEIDSFMNDDVFKDTIISREKTELKNETADNYAKGMEEIFELTNDIQILDNDKPKEDNENDKEEKSSKGNKKENHSKNDDDAENNADNKTKEDNEKSGFSQQINEEHEEHEEHEEENIYIKNEEEIEHEEESNENENKDDTKNILEIDNTLLSRMFVGLLEDSTKIIAPIIDDNKDKNNSEKTKLAISEMSIRYGYSKDEVVQKITRYEKYTKEVKELEDKKSNEAFIRQAIKEKKRSLEDDTLSSGINLLLKNIQNDIQDDNFIEGIDKNTIYKNNFLQYIKKAILSHVEKSNADYENDNYSEQNLIEVFNIFSKKYNIRTLDLDKNALIGLMLNNNSFENYVTLLSLFYDNDKVKDSILMLEKDIKELQFSVEKVFYI